MPSSSAVAMQKTIEEFHEIIKELSEEVKGLKETVERMEGQIPKPKPKKPKADGEVKPKVKKDDHDDDGFKKPKVVLPNLYLDGDLIVLPGRCQAIQCNHQLFTQCLEPQNDGEDYCTKCQKGGLKYGTIDKRDDPEWVDTSGKTKRKPKPAANLWKTLNITQEQAEKAKDDFLQQFGDEFAGAEFHQDDLQARGRGRPSTKSSTSSTESTPVKKQPPKKRGAPKKSSPTVIVDDTDDDNEKPKEIVVKKKKPTTKELFGDDSDDEEEKPKKTVVKKKSALVKDLFGDDSDDDDDDEDGDEVIKAMNKAKEELDTLEEIIEPKDELQVFEEEDVCSDPESSSEEEVDED